MGYYMIHSVYITWYAACNSYTHALYTCLHIYIHTLTRSHTHTHTHFMSMVRVFLGPHLCSRILGPHLFSRVVSRQSCSQHKNWVIPKVMLMFFASVCPVVSAHFQQAFFKISTDAGWPRDVVGRVVYRQNAADTRARELRHCRSRSRFVRLCYSVVLCGAVWCRVAQCRVV